MKMSKKHSIGTTKLILRKLDQTAKLHGLELTRHAVNKWANAQRARNRLTKQRKQLRAELARVNRGLRT